VSDTRFVIIGIVLIFSGFIILGVFGPQYMESTVQAQEFGNCFEYTEDAPPKQVECQVALQEKLILGAIVLVLIGAGIIALVKGVKGKWDQDVKPEDMLGPSRPGYPSGPDEPTKSDSD